MGMGSHTPKAGDQGIQRLRAGYIYVDPTGKPRPEVVSPEVVLMLYNSHDATWVSS